MKKKNKSIEEIYYEKEIEKNYRKIFWIFYIKRRKPKK